MTSIEEADSWVGRTAVDNTGEQIGMITQIWVDDASGEPAWASVDVIGRRGPEAIVPLAGMTAFGGGRRFAYSKEDIVGAPQAGAVGRLEVADMQRLSSYYGAPDARPAGGSSWVDRMDDAADGATVREIHELLGPNHSAPPAAKAPAAGKRSKRSKRFGRKAASTEPKTTRLLRGNASRSGGQPADLPLPHDEAAAGH